VKTYFRPEGLPENRRQSRTIFGERQATTRLNGVNTPYNMFRVRRETIIPPPRQSAPCAGREVFISV